MFYKTNQIKNRIICIVESSDKGIYLVVSWNLEPELLQVGRGI